MCWVMAYGTLHCSSPTVRIRRPVLCILRLQEGVKVRYISYLVIGKNLQYTCMLSVLSNDFCQDGIYILFASVPKECTEKDWTKITKNVSDVRRH
ncbi:hypothetical protein FKM82_030889 [Ascaphus truei]